MISNSLPGSLVDNPYLDQWIALVEPGIVRIATGKVELGQGILTALVQIAAEELDVAPSRIRIISGDTTATPAEGVTAGSLSVEQSGGAIRLVMAEVRAMALAAAAQRLNCPVVRLTLVDGQVHRDGAPTGLDLWQLGPSLKLTERATGRVPVKSWRDHSVIGASLPRIDLPAKVFGGNAPFIHDMTVTGLLHARVLRQPWPEAELSATPVVQLPDGITMLRVGRTRALVGANEHVVITAAERLAASLHWTGGRPILADQVDAQGFKQRPTIDGIIERGTSSAAPATSRITRTYTKPFIAHASIAPSCALARFADARLEVWTHSQGVVPLRGSLARVLALAPETITVRHLQGAGCYGHNGADDAACDAAMVAVQCPGETIRVQWSREDELGSAPFGTTMAVQIDAELDAQGRPLNWNTDIWGGTHVQRPGAGGGINLLAAQGGADPLPTAVPFELPESSGGSGMRNAWLLYDVPHQIIRNHIVADLSVRTSSMRGLGGFANVFAIESFVDELATAANTDPLAFRLAMTSDPRARAVITRASEMAGWTTSARQPEGFGRGMAYSRYKNRAGYLAIVVDVRVAETVHLEHIWCAVDAGLVINPDGVRNQVEGGIIQAASWTLKEAVTFEDGRVASRTWDRYPILRFSEVPPIVIDLMDQRGEAPLGVGEVAAGPTAAAIANAVANALGVRVRDLPLTRDSIVAASM